MNILILVISIFVIIGIFIVIKIIIPLNKIFLEVKNANIIQNNDLNKELESKDKIGFLATQFHFLLEQVETIRKTFEEQIQLKTHQIKNRLKNDK